MSHSIDLAVTEVTRETNYHSEKRIESRADLSEETLTDSNESPPQQKNEDTTTTGSDDDIPQYKKMKPQELILLFTGLVMACFLASLDGTIVSTALVTIASEFNAISKLSWVVTGYLLTYNAFQPLYGKFSDIFGRRNTLVFAATVFLLSSAGCGAANSIELLIFFRALAGVGGAGLLGLVLIVISDLFPLDKRPKYQAIIWATFGLSSIVGPLLGGAFVDKLTWRWDFYINLPFSAFTIVCVLFFLRLPFKATGFVEKLKRIDYLGSFLIIMIVVSILLPTSWGGTTYAWKSAPVISLYCVAVILIGIFVFVELKVAVEPIIPGHIFRSVTVCAVYVTNFLTGAAFFSVIFYTPIFYQSTRGENATDSGLQLLPMLLGLVIFSMISGALVAKVPGGYKVFITFGAALVVVGLGLLSTLNENTSRVAQIFYLLITGIGLGCELQMCLLAAQSASKEEDMAIVTGLAGFFQSIGGGIGVAVASAVFSNALANNVDYIPANLLTPEVLRTLTNSISAIHQLDDTVRPYVIHVYVMAIQQVFRVGIPFAGVAFISSLFIRSYKLVDLKKAEMMAA